MLRATALSGATLLSSLLGAAAFAAPATAPASAAATSAPTTSEPATPRQLVEAIHGIFGEHHARAVHAKGIVLEGTFTPDPAAATLTKAPHLQKERSKLVVRFSDTTGLPEVPDNVGDASPRGMGIKFKLPSGSVTDIVSHSYNGFPVATADEFRTFLLAIPASGPEAPKPTPLETFLGSHPAAKAFATTQKIPASFATTSYFGVNSFKFTNAAGASSFVRYQVVPDAGESTLSPAEAAKKGPNYLIDDVKARILKHHVTFKLFAQVAEAGDKIEDPSIAWPDTRKRVLLGKLEITKLGANTPAADQALAYDPNNIPDGIEAADPMIRFRSRAYPFSVRERRAGGEEHAPTAKQATAEEPTAKE
jgi:catalase